MASTFFPITSLTDTENEQFADRIAALPADEANILLSANTSAFIREKIGTVYGLNGNQMGAIARVVAEIILHITPANHAVEQLIRTAHLELSVAAAVIEAIGQGLFEPKGMSLSGYNTAAAEPALLTDREGKEGLRYDSLNDLMADLEPLEPGDRMKFLDDAKKFNRIFVLQAFSQLKMGATGGGQPLPFRKLVAQEADTFTPLDWIDLLRIDPDAADEPAVWDILQHSALGAMVRERDTAGRREIASELASVPVELQALATSPVIGAIIDEFVKNGTLPETHAIAVGRVFYFLCVGKILPSQTQSTLEQLGLQPVASAGISQKLNALIPAPSQLPAAPELAETSPARAAAPIRTVPSAASRNIIDLRKQQPAQ